MALTITAETVLAVARPGAGASLEDHMAGVMARVTEIRTADKASTAVDRSWEDTTMVQINREGARVPVSTLRAVFEVIEDKGRWKNPCAGYVHHSLVAITLAAIEYFHGAPGRIVGARLGDGWVLVESDGYACD